MAGRGAPSVLRPTATARVLPTLRRPEVVASPAPLPIPQALPAGLTAATDTARDVGPRRPLRVRVATPSRPVPDGLAVGVRQRQGPCVTAATAPLPRTVSAAAGLANPTTVGDILVFAKVADGVTSAYAPVPVAQTARPLTTRSIGAPIDRLRQVPRAVLPMPSPTKRPAPLAVPARLQDALALARLTDPGLVLEGTT